MQSVFTINLSGYAVGNLLAMYCFSVWGAEGHHYITVCVDQSSSIHVLLLCLLLFTVKCTSNLPCVVLRDLCLGFPGAHTSPPVWCLAAAVLWSISTVRNSVGDPGVPATLGVLLHVRCSLLGCRQEWLHCCCESGLSSSPHMQAH